MSIERKASAGYEMRVIESCLSGDDSKDSFICDCKDPEMAFFISRSRNNSRSAGKVFLVYDRSGVLKSEILKMLS